MQQFNKGDKVRINGQDSVIDYWPPKGEGVFRYSTFAQNGGQIQNTAYTSMVTVSLDQERETIQLGGLGGPANKPIPNAAIELVEPAPPPPPGRELPADLRRELEEDRRARQRERDADAAGMEERITEKVTTAVTGALEGMLGRLLGQGGVLLGGNNVPEPQVLGVWPAHPAVVDEILANAEDTYVPAEPMLQGTYAVFDGEELAVTADIRGDRIEQDVPVPKAVPFPRPATGRGPGRS